MRTKKIQIILIAGALLLFVLLFIAPKTAPSKGNHVSEQSETNLAPNANLEMYLTMAVKALEPNKKQALDKLVNAKDYDSAQVFWDKLKRPDLASHYAEESAKENNGAEQWLKAGNRYYYAIQFTQDKTEIPVLYQCATRCFEKCLALDDKNTDAKIMLASCYVEGSSNPMQGVSLLREVEQADSNNVKMQLAFAFFSVKSGQLDKAITRFNKVLKIDSTYIEAYLHLADAYEQQGDEHNTIEVLKKYAAKTNDVTARIEIGKYIKQLEQHHGTH
ncbi:MAG: tetratricopeptide repeat protein [Bacteroidetes bacterium]|nr:tetratricopeptide repeat protein [Bacteroidota bacterium]